jgi:predicted glycosyltransferase
MPAEKRKIVISPLNWGFGHAGRMIPVAQRLQEMGHEVIFCADAGLIPMIKQEVPGIGIVEVKGINMHYSRLMPQYVAVLLQVPSTIIASVKEHRELRKIVRNIQPDIVISDNRFGFFNRNVFCVYVTHMIRIPFPGPFRFLEFIGIILHRLIINRYDMCLIPDMPGVENLSGRLSHLKKIPSKAVYAGLLSRFAGREAGKAGKEPYACLILSGPEPQRTIFLQKMVRAAERNKTKLIVLSGEKICCTFNENYVKSVIGQPSSVLQEYIINAGIVICRSGYTSLMELLSLSRGAVIIPTPGQTEQEYLGRYNNGRHGFTCLKQNDLDKFNLSVTDRHDDSAPFTGAFSLLDEALQLMLQEEKKRTYH